MLKCSHILCKVNNIANLVRDYESLGFCIEWGSAPKRALNALLWFEKGPFIEFFSIPRAFRYLGPPLGLAFGAAAAKRWTHWSRASQGWCDVALELEPADRTKEAASGAQIANRQDLKAIRTSMNQSGLPTSRIINGSRTRPDGVKVRYSLFTPEPVDLPFVVSAYDPPQRPGKIKHPNGASGVEWVKIGVAREHLHRFQRLSRSDKWLEIEPALQTRVLEVGLSGLSTQFDSRFLHGAVFAASGKRQFIHKPQRSGKTGE